MNVFKGKSIILAAPNHYGLLQRFKENLEAIGFNVIVVPDDTKVKIGIKNTLLHIYKKFIFKDQTFKREKKIKLRSYSQINLIESKNIEKFDYALVIRPDLFSNDLLLHIKNSTHLACAYQWDGMDRFASVYEKIKFFDRFFVFDENDAKKNKKLIPITNFYFDDIRATKNIKTDVYFVGTYLENRIGILLKLSKKLKDLGLRVSINLSIKSSKDLKKIKPNLIKIINKPISFKENLINSSQTNIIIDLTNNIHNGISMRTFESIKFKKKLITNNSLVKKYDFYTPNNIFVIENDKLEGIENFLKTSYESLPKEIYDKYSFTNWMKIIMNVK